MLEDLILANRTYRRFYQDVRIPMDTLKEMINLARLASSGGNLQSLRYVLVNQEDKNELIFKTLKWAGYLSDWNGPGEGEKPSAYIVMLHDQRINKSYLWDHGLAAQNILLGLTEKGLGACQFHSINRVELASKLNLPAYYEIVMVIAAGKPKEIVVLEEVDASGNIRYWRDQEGTHHVPKRKPDDLILEI